MIEPAGHHGEAILLNLINGFPGRKFKVIGITGTNGKTTTAFMVHRMLHEAGYKVGLMTTVAYGVGGNIKPQDVHMTNVPVPLMMKRLKYLHNRGAEWLVMEVTSQALAQNRVWGVPFHLAVMTNISQDHLDYHLTMDRYVNSKVKLFRLADRNHGGLRLGIINADDETAGRFAKAVSKKLTYGFDKGELRAAAIKTSAGSSSFTALTDTEELKIKLNLPGRFNVYNALAAIGVGLALGISNKMIERGIAALEGVPGRMTSFKAKAGYNAVVDFAHTPDALENAIQAVKAGTKGNVILVFGATGDRDKSKRPVMGEVAAGIADRIFLTDDETYTENPGAIIDEVYKGIVAAGGKSKTTIIDDRFEAIKAAFAAAKKDDTVLLTGIGHETTRNMGGKEEPWNEIQIVKDLLSKA